MSKIELPTKSTRDIFEGALNINVLRPGPILNGRTTRILRRFPKENRTIFESIAHEYNTIGFTRVGGQLRRRSQSEQTKFTKFCAIHGLRVIPPLAEDNKYVDNLFLDGAETLDVYLAHATDEQVAQCTHEIYMDMYKAHNAGVVYGDRWSENILVVPGAGVVNIDFDLEIFGRFAKEFDAAQVAYYILAGAKGRVISQLAKLLSTPYANLDLAKVEMFLRGHAIHFDSNKKYGNLMNEVTTLIELMHKEYESSRRSV